MTWFNVIARRNDDQQLTAEISIYDQIGKNWFSDDGVAAKEFTEAVEALGDVSHIKLMLNSPGGSIRDGMQIYNFLRRHQAQVEVLVLAEASSIASVIVQAADKRVMCKGAIMMVHDPMAWAGGYVNAQQCQKLASTLTTYKESLINAYTETTGLDRDTVASLMSAETFMTAEEAIEKGFADALDETYVSNCRTADHDQLKNQVANELKPPKAPASPKPTTANQSKPMDALALIKACDQAGVAFLAQSLLEKQLTESAFKQALNQAQAIRNACVVGNLTDSAEGLIKVMHDPAKLIGQVIQDVKASLEPDDLNGEISSHVNTPKININDIYQARQRTTA
ncbi:head maturation protease, ClpP-related [Spartinivicinus ruber]|uniref:head maturation protease, ClpP-related n=1 Tax=Spartinivicinus ruber TaxID=2683272 RepID=UPI0013D1DAF0|nr:head maturation protease, ClpP-related [Spartinivicinus ruber]